MKTLISAIVCSTFATVASAQMPAETAARLSEPIDVERSEKVVTVPIERKMGKLLVPVACPRESGPFFELVPASEMELNNGQASEA